MKKNLLCLVSNIRAVALSLAVVCSTIASWATPSVDDTFIEGDLKYTVTRVDPYECSVGYANENITEAQIPETVSYDGVNLKVTSIGRSAFYYCFSLSSVTIPESVTSIGELAFYYCFSLSSIEIPNSVTSIGEYTFTGCSKLIDITIPEGVTSIGDGTFYECTSLSSVTIPNSVTSIGEYAFRNCTSLSSITIPSRVTSIGDYAFYRCTLISSVTIPSSVTSIGNYAFDSCTSLSSVTIPESVKSIGESAFYGTSLSSITIPESVTSIGWYTFARCHKLTNITIPSSVTSIGEYAFGYCPLTQVTCLGETPPVCNSNTFDGVNVSSCKLIVPKYGEGELYKKDSIWGQFNIAPSGVEDVTIDDDAVEVERYNINGVKLSVPQKGINIVKMSDGSVKKVVVSE